MENTFIPCTPNIARCMKFWKTEKQTPAEDRAGSFNLELYLDYTNKVNQGEAYPVKDQDKKQNFDIVKIQQEQKSFYQKALNYVKEFFN
jgi:hypothetical protein